MVEVPLELDDSPPADAARAVCETFVCATGTWRAGCSRLNSRLALAAGVSVCEAIVVEADVDAPA